ncbi:MAG: DUF1015 domain-containing protein [Thermoleophilia bacterium]
MADLRPSRPLRYLPGAGALGDLIAPPYDVISAEEHARLLARSPHNSVRLELAEEPFTEARAALADWQRDGVLGRPERPGITAWTQTFQIDGRTLERHTLLGTLKLEPYEARVVRPHERTHAGPVEGRLRLYAALNAHISPVFGVYPDPENRVWAAAGVLDAPEAEFVSDDGAVVNRIRWIDDPARLEAVRAELADRWVLIADGHHRYETALIHRGRVRAANGDQPGPWDDVLMGVSSLHDPGLVVLPTHRLLTRWPEGAAGRLGHTPVADLDALLAALAAAPAEVPTFGLVRPDGLALLSFAGPAGDTPASRLDVAVLEREVLIPDLGDDQAALSHHGVLDYTKDAREALRAVTAGTMAAAVILRPIPKEAVAAVSEAGETMPQKSTYFFPKLLTGVAFHPLTT